LSSSKLKERLRMPRVEIRLEQNHMNTTFELHVSCEESRTGAAEAALLEAHGEISRLEDELSEFRAASPVARLNRAPAFEPVPLTASVRELLRISETVRVGSNGAFNPLWRSTDPGAVLLTADGQSFFRTTEGTHLGFGAIGKGYALDRVRVMLERNGFSDYLLSAGGSSVLMSGFAAPGVPWRWAWSWKKDESGNYLGRRFTHVTGRTIALGVSGLMEQGRHIAHGEEPCESLSALVAHASAARADALSTALFVSGWRDIERLRDPLEPTPLAWIDVEENLRWNGDFQACWGSPCS
jgi:thiamine biosynthesis lipoprotein